MLLVRNNNHQCSSRIKLISYNVVLTSSQEAFKNFVMKMRDNLVVTTKMLLPMTTKKASSLCHRNNISNSTYIIIRACITHLKLVRAEVADMVAIKMRDRDSRTRWSPSTSPSLTATQARRQVAPSPITTLLLVPTRWHLLLCQLKTKSWLHLLLTKPKEDTRISRRRP